MNIEFTTQELEDLIMVYENYISEYGTTYLDEVRDWARRGNEVIKRIESILENELEHKINE